MFSNDTHAGLIIQRPNYTGLNAGLVGFWSFDGKDMSGDLSLDRSGQGNNGTLTNGPLRVKGKLGQALNFGGSNDYVNIGAPSSLDNIVTKTISAWIYPRSVGESNAGRIMDKNQGGIAGWYFATCSDPDGGSRCSAAGSSNALLYEHNFASGSVGAWVTGNNTLTLNAWNHVVVTYSRSSTANNPVFYINGVVRSGTSVGNQTGTAPSDTGLENTIGNRTDTAATFNGLIDDVRIYNRVLTADEIKRLYMIGGGN